MFLYTTLVQANLVYDFEVHTVQYIYHRTNIYS